MRHALAPHVLIALLLVCTQAAYAAQTADVAARMRASMVIVSSHIGPHQDAIGAGVVVALSANRLRVVTARHVADNGPVTIWIDGRPHPAEIVRTVADRDLAVVDTFGSHLDRLPIQPATLASQPSPGSALAIWGEDESGLRMHTGAIISTAFVPMDRSGVPLLSVTCDGCSHGDSGGGIFDRTGSLLAILTARYYGAENRTIAIVGEFINASLYASSDGPFVFPAPLTK